MTDEPWTCGDGCPWKGCPSCFYKGGTDPAQTRQIDCAMRRLEGKRTAPGGASTPLVQGPRPSDSTGGLMNIIPTPASPVNTPGGGV